jgi:hypothetical protein
LATGAHGRKDENKILMATESTEEHGKIKSGLCAGYAATGVPAARTVKVMLNVSIGLM